MAKQPKDTVRHDDADLDDLEEDLDELDDDELAATDDDPDLEQPATLAWRRRTGAEMLVSGVLGLLAAFQLSIDAWLLAEDPDRNLACNISKVISCGTVANSWQAKLLHFPNAFLGILFESVVLTVSLALISGVVFPRWFMRGVQALYTVALFFALWLFLQAYFVIHALCPWCLFITFTTVLVFAGLTRINLRDGHVPSTPAIRRFIVTPTYWYIAVAVCAIIAAMILGKYGTSLID
ncbi:MAG: vitamin K epoxide reductase family protein [Micrococcales bacterium]|nr:vitamin K epoxide reductase family protein [Micrococcales bacterium]MCL2666342.1 vitamin K epoxide reductase family protein [Micrococcales bacterium]